MLLNLLNLYSLIFALFNKIDDMSKELVSLQPDLKLNATNFSDVTLHHIKESLPKDIHTSCIETTIPCVPCEMLTTPIPLSQNSFFPVTYGQLTSFSGNDMNINKRNKKRNVIYESKSEKSDVIKYTDDAFLKEIEKIKNISKLSASEDYFETTSGTNESDSYDINYDIFSPSNLEPISESDTNYNYNDYTSSPLHSSTSIITEITKLGSTSSDYTTDYITTHTETDQTMTQSTHSSEDSFFTEKSNSPPTVYTEPVTNNEYDSSGTSATDKNWDDKSATQTSSLNSGDFTTEISFTDARFEEISNPTSTYTSSFSEGATICPDISFNCSINCGDKNITQTFYMSNCKIVLTRCYLKQCKSLGANLKDLNQNHTNVTIKDTAYQDAYYKRKVYNLTIATRKKLLKLCWETMFGQELVKLTMMDLVRILFICSSLLYY